MQIKSFTYLDRILKDIFTVERVPTHLPTIFADEAEDAESRVRARRYMNEQL